MYGKGLRKFVFSDGNTTTTILFLLNCRDFYRPQTKFAKVMFLHVSVSHSVHRGVRPIACWVTHPTGPEAGTPQTRHPLDQTPP